MKNIKELDKIYVMNTYNRCDLQIVEGMECNCYDQNNKEYLDLGSGIGVNCLGYSDVGWVNAITAQACKLNHCSNLYYSEPCATLAEKLCQKLDYSKVFFANSGAEANECAIKLARKYSFDKYGKDRYKIITLQNSFHGRTMATLSATGQDTFHQFFDPFLQGFQYAIANDFADMACKIDQKTCAVIIEFVQGEGGVNVLDKEYVQQIYDLCQSKDILFIADEVQTGVGRTGKFLASMWYDIHPNITTLAKGLGGGLPIGAVLADEKTQNTLGFSTHGSTFGGNPIACAGANYILDNLNPELLDEVTKKGQFIKDLLSNCSEIESVTGLGLMLGIKLKTKKASDVVALARQKGIIMLTAKDKIRLLPPLVISYNQLQSAINILLAILQE